MPSPILTRRNFLFTSIAAGAAVALPSLAAEESEVTPNEDLMREHGLLRRIVLIYEANLARFPRKEHQPEVIREAAGHVRNFIENYHEKIEEEFLFPALQKAKREMALVDVLKTQHEAGRKLTAQIMALSGEGFGSLPELEKNIRTFIHMYNAHAAREDTVLFPAFKEVVGPRRYKDFGEQFEEREHKQFGKDGFEGVLAKVAELESRMGIADLSSYTPKLA